MRLCIAQINLLVGDIEKNKNKIIANINKARDKHKANIVIFPELTITGYPPDDLILRPGLYQQISDALKNIIDETHNIVVLIGYPEKQKNHYFNACCVIQNGSIKQNYRKKVLPNYGVFDEKRYFSQGKEICLIDLFGIPTAISICEDLWTTKYANDAARSGAKLLINLNASPYHHEKVKDRQRLLKKRIKKTGLNIIYTNLVGGQDELVFDGGSMVMDNTEEMIFHAPQFEEGLYCVDISNEQGNLKFQPGHVQQPVLSNEESIYQALVLGVKDYVQKNGFTGVVIGLSGGIDSALTLSIAVDAIGAENIEVILMPSRYTSDMSIEDAKTMAENMGVHYDLISIEKPFSAFTDILSPVFTGLPVDITEENIQARCRGILLMAISNKTGKLVLTTGNKSEMAVGYATLYGDMAGGFAPLKDVSKTLVYKLANWRNSKETIIPQRIIDRPPSAELRPDQKDIDSLPPYDVLDSILERYIELDQSPGEIIKAGYKKETVLEIVRLIDRNEYKRRQAPPGIKISKRAFGKDRRYPITSGYKEY